MKVHLKLAGVKLDKKVRELHKHPYIESFTFLSFFLSFFSSFFRLLTERHSLVLPFTSIHFHTPCSPGYDWLFRPVRIYVPNLQPGVYPAFYIRKIYVVQRLCFSLPFLCSRKLQSLRSMFQSLHFYVLVFRSALPSCPTPSCHHCIRSIGYDLPPPSIHPSTPTPAPPTPAPPCPRTVTLRFGHPIQVWMLLLMQVQIAAVLSQWCTSRR